MNCPAIILPVSAMLPVVLDIVRLPVVENAPIFCAVVPLIVTPPEPLIVPPLLTRLSFIVRAFAPRSRIAPLLTVNGLPELKTLASLRVICPEAARVTPPVAVNVLTH